MRSLSYFFLTISIIALFSCTTSKEEDYSRIYGNWFYFNFDLDSLESYNEIYVDSLAISHHTNMMGTSRNYPYTVSNDSIIYLNEDGSPSRTMGVLKSIKPDTLLLEELNYDETIHQVLTLIRVVEDSSFKANKDYEPDNVLLEKSKQRIHFIHRSYGQYLKAGFINKQEYELMINETIQISIDDLQ